MAQNWIFLGVKKKAGNLDKVPFYVELGPGGLSVERAEETLNFKILL